MSRCSSADGTVLLNNDDNGSGYGDYAYYNSLIPNYYISVERHYTIEVTGVNGGGGSFGVTIGTLPRLIAMLSPVLSKRQDSHE